MDLLHVFLSVYIQFMCCSACGYSWNPEQWNMMHALVHVHDQDTCMILLRSLLIVVFKQAALWLWTDLIIQWNTVV